MNKLVIVSIDTENDVCVFNKVDDRDPNNVNIQQCTRTVAIAKAMFTDAKEKAVAQKNAAIQMIDSLVAVIEAELAQFPA
jgi:hypothetical protein